MYIIKIAYIPYDVISRLGDLVKPYYNKHHEYFVDGSPASGDVFFDSDWHTVLVGGLRGGGRSIYALDITGPDNFADTSPEDTVLWEFQNPDLGYTYGKPSIVRLHNSTWAALFGNGYNSDDQSARLFAVQLSNSGKDKTDPTSWQILAASGNDKPNGLSEVFPVDVDGDFITDYVYAGDLQGNLWRFDLTSTDPSNWTATKIFTAKDSSGNVQPITTQPQVGSHPYGLDYGVMVYFGTGKYLEKGDRNSTPENTFYGIWDPGISSNTKDGQFLPAFTGASDTTRDNLVHQSIETEQSKSATVDGNTVTNTYRAVSDKNVSYPSKVVLASDTPSLPNDYDHGWLLDFPKDANGATGERVVTNPQLQEGQRGRDDTVSFSTQIPRSTTACGASGGGFFMVLNQPNGGRTHTPVFDLNGDGLFTNADKTLSDGQGNDVEASGRKFSSSMPGEATHQSNQNSRKAYYIVPTSDAKTTTIPIPLLGKNGRVSWREIRR